MNYFNIQIETSWRQIDVVNINKGAREKLEFGYFCLPRMVSAVIHLLRARTAAKRQRNTDTLSHSTPLSPRARPAWQLVAMAVSSSQLRVIGDPWVTMLDRHGKDMMPCGGEIESEMNG